jgi:hypothetical protein
MHVARCCTDGTMSVPEGPSKSSVNVMLGNLAGRLDILQEAARGSSALRSEILIREK